MLKLSYTEIKSLRDKNVIEWGGVWYRK
jgi:hypothetical protein